MLDFINRILGKESQSSKSVAKERLRLVLVHDRASISPHLLNALKEDLIKVISEYMEIDQSALEVNLNSEDNSVALIANIPVIKMKRNYAEQPETNQPTAS
ncbi:MAG TPA: cell division topological specificity factor MinE [Desulfobacteria bacterium]|nr:cell division topological specificity factor MinE [Desulfobacteria bacterium]